MNRALLIFFFYSVALGFCSGQTNPWINPKDAYMDSVRHQALFAPQDSSRILAMIRLAQMHMFTRPDSSIIYSTKPI
jgi:hypothetical protein